MNRDDDAYSFCRYWMRENLEREAEHATSHEGDWLHPREEGCRFLDIFAECPEVTPKCMDLPFLVIILIIKMRLVAGLEGYELSDMDTNQRNSN